MSGARLGAVVGSVGGLIFILVNAGGLPDPAAWVVRVAGIAAFLASLWLQRTRSGGADDGTRPDRRAMRVYWLCVAAEVISIPIGANVISRGFDRPELVVLWVVAVVGAHFLPFAAVFRAPVFTPLGWILIGLAAAGVRRRGEQPHEGELSHRHRVCWNACGNTGSGRLSSICGTPVSPPTALAHP